MGGSSFRLLDPGMPGDGAALCSGLIGLPACAAGSGIVRAPALADMVAVVGLSSEGASRAGGVVAWSVEVPESADA